MQTLSRSRNRSRAGYVLAVVLTIAAGLASRRFPQALPGFLGKYPGDALWALMVFFGLGAIFARASTGRVAVGALAFACTIECLKLWSAPWLVQVRHTTLGHLVLGHVFWWPNFFAYAAGVLAGVAIEWTGSRFRRAAPR